MGALKYVLQFVKKIVAFKFNLSNNLLNPKPNLSVLLKEKINNYKLKILNPFSTVSELTRLCNFL